MISKINVKDIKLYLNNKKDNIKTKIIPTETQTFHRLIPKKYFNNYQFHNLMVFQYYYLLYPYNSNYTNDSQINKNISKDKFDDVYVKFELKSMNNLYIIDIYDAEKYLRQNKNLFTLNEYYRIIAQTFKKYEDLSMNQIVELKSPIYLLQRPVDFDNELIEIM
jgi:hypothetical protein